MFLPLKDLTELDLSSCDLVEIWSEQISANLPISTVLKNLKLLNVSNNNIVHLRHSHFQSMEKLEVLDLNNNHLHCDDGFKNLIQWLKERKVYKNQNACASADQFYGLFSCYFSYQQIKSGNIHAGFNAELTENGHAVDTTSSYSLGWESFATNVCAQAHQSTNVDSKPITKTDEYTDESVDNSDSDDSEDADDDDTDESSKFSWTSFTSLGSRLSKCYKLNFSSFQLKPPRILHPITQMLRIWMMMMNMMMTIMTMKLKLTMEMN